MTLIDNQIWTNSVDYWGETVTLRVVTDTTYSDYGDATESTADTASIKAMVNDITPEQIKETEGVLNGDDKIFFFKPGQASIIEGNRIIHDSLTYEIIRVLKRQTAGSTFVQEAWGKKT